MKRFALCSALVAGSLLVAGSAMAQAPAAPAAPAAPVAAPPPVVAAPKAPTLSPAHHELAIEVVRLSGMSRSIDVLVPQMVDRSRTLFTQMRPEVAGEVDKSIKALQPEFDALQGEAIRIAGAAFGARLSEAELKDIKVFFTSPSGQKFVTAQPGILDDMFRDLEPFAQRLSQTVVDKLREDMKKRGVPF